MAAVSDSDDKTLSWQPDDERVEALLLSAPGLGSDPRVFSGATSPPPWLLELERFEFREFLGQGGGGVVYRVLDRELGVEVALKTLPRLNPRAQQRLKREFRTLADTVYHDNIVALYELFVVGERGFFTMELIEGSDLLSHVRRTAVLDVGASRRLLRALRQLVAAVDAVHAAGLLHRDIKPSNILISEAEQRLVLLDFGLVAPQASLKAGQGGPAGTWVYMAPEQYTGGQVDVSADWFAVGTTLYHVLTDLLPPRRSADGWFAQALPPLRGMLPQVPGWLAEATLGLMAASRAERLSAAHALSERLEVTTRPPVLVRDNACVGRAAPLAALEAAFRGVCAGTGQVVRIAGRSGIGKSHLVRHFLGQVRTQLAPGALLLEGRCSALESVPYKALDGAIDDLARQCRRTLPGPISGWEALLRLFPVLGRIRLQDEDEDDVVPADPDELRQLGVEALAGLLDATRGDQPVVMWIDDMQWGDLDSLALLRALLSCALPLLVVVTYRAEEADQSPVLRRLAAAPVGPEQVLRLAPLEPAAARALATSLVGDDPERVALIVREAKGSPFFIDVMARDPSAVSLEGVVSRRLEKLSVPARELLQVAAVAAAPVPQQAVLSAAGREPRHRPLLTALQRQQLLRPTSIDHVPAVVVYHDRIREALVQEMAPQARVGFHRALYQHFAATAEPDPEALLAHSRGAELWTDAARWAVAAAEHASQALAFSRAAELFEEALALGAPEPVVLRIRLAEALVYASRGSEAPAHFLLAAAAVSDPGQALDLRRRAAEQYIRNGLLDEGMAAFGALLSEIGVRMPSSPVLATAQIVWRRSLMAIRRAPAALVDAAQVDPAQLRRMDALFGAVSGLGLVDPTTASALALQHFAMATQTGEPIRLCQAYGYEATVAAALGGRWRQRAQHYAALADSVAEQAGLTVANVPELAGYRCFVHCNARWFAGAWRDSLDVGVEAARIYDLHVPGSNWHVTAADHYILSCLTFLGDLAAVRERRAVGLRAAIRRGDRFGEGMLLLGDHNLVDILDGRGQEIAGHVDQLPALWPVLTYHRAKFEVQRALHDGDPEAAWRHLEAAWPRLKALQFLLMEMSRLLLWDLRGRVALACGGPKAAARVREALRAIRACALPPAAPMADLLEAGLGGPAGAVLRERAADGFADAGMALHAAVARGEAPDAARVLAPTPR